MKSYLIILSIVCLCVSCQKDWLDAKPNQSDIVPTTLKDFQALLDNNTLFNTNLPTLPEYGCDDYYLPTNVILSRVKRDINIYTWAPGDVFEGDAIGDWSSPYSQIFNANSILEGIGKIERTESNQLLWNNVKGSALFVRAFAYHNLAGLFCKPYSASTADSDLGLILRTESNINQPSVRASVNDTYSLIINDLIDAIDLLGTTPLYRTRPSKQAALALLARVYLTMDNYDSARKYSNESLQIQGALKNYNIGVSKTVTNPFSFSTNEEIIYNARLVNNSMLAGEGKTGYVDSALFSLYAANDLRRVIFFKTQTGTPSRLYFGGSYYGASFFFGGLATDEQYLIRAECAARKGDTTAALKDLNDLYKMRWDSTKPYVRIVAVDATDAIKKILTERRKQLCFRAIRWLDLRRINKDPQFAKTLTRNVNQIITLPPNDNRYTWPIPDNEILISGVPQNPR